MLQAMLKADDIIKNIFGIKSGTMGGIMETAIDLGLSFGAIKALDSVFQPRKRIINKINNTLASDVNNKYNENGYDGTNSFMVQQMKFAEQMQKLEIAEKQGYNKSAREAFAHTGKMFKNVAASVPITYEKDPILGATNMIAADNDYSEEFLIDDPNLPPLPLEEAEGMQNGSSDNSSVQLVEGEANELNSNRQLNLEKKKRNSRVGKVILSLATAGVSTKVENIVQNKEITENIIAEQEERTRRSYVYLERMKERMEQIDEDIEEKKFRNQTKAFYTPKEEETENQQKINLKIKESDRGELETLLKQNLTKPEFKNKEIEKALEGIKQDDVLTESELKDITAKVLKREGYDVGEKFEQNLKSEAVDRLFKYIEKQGAVERVKKITLNANIQDRIEKIAKLHGSDKKEAIKEFKQDITADETTDIVNSFGKEDIVDLVTAIANKKGTAKKKEVPEIYKKLIENTKKLQDLNNKMYELGNKKAPTTEDLIQSILGKDKENTKKKTEGKVR
jgi:hypothetical protein